MCLVKKTVGRRVPDETGVRLRERLVGMVRFLQKTAGSVRH
jgi:hypothetical protein